VSLPPELLPLPPQPAAVAASATTGSASSHRALPSFRLPFLSIRTVFLPLDRVRLARLVAVAASPM
jgi:hypothetical protein